MIRDAILPCAQKLTQVSLIYCTEPKNKKWEKEKLKMDMLRSIDKPSGNPWSQSSRRKRRLWWSCWSIAAAVACEFGQCHIVSVVGSWRETCCLWNDIFLPLLPLTQFHSCPTFFLCTVIAGYCNFLYFCFPAYSFSPRSVSTTTPLSPLLPFPLCFPFCCFHLLIFICINIKKLPDH